MDQTAPGAFADEQTDLSVMKHVGHQVASGTGHLVNDHHLRYPFTSPSAGIWGPKVIIINEMAGSGGDLMPYMFHYRKIGLLVGKRTWGGLVHTADTPTFVDGGSAIAPRGGFFARDNRWAVENEGVAPDIDVENWPKDVIAGP